MRLDEIDVGLLLSDERLAANARLLAALVPALSCLPRTVLVRGSRLGGSMVARFDSAPAATAIPLRFREMARELLSETWSAARAIDNAWHTTFSEFECCRAELLSQQLRSQEIQLAAQQQLDQLRAQLTGENQQAAQERAGEAAALRNTVVELQEQRTILELELEHARRQTIQLNAELTELRQQQTLDREDMQAELRQLRLAVERPWSGVPVAHEHSPAQVAPVLPAEFAPAYAAAQESAAPVIEATAAAMPASRDAEPGLGLVLNHFQTLQKDLARRRAPSKVPKQTG